MTFLGIYIDSDNISYKYAKKLMEDMNTRGTFTIKKIFGDWSKSESKNWHKEIQNNGLEAVQCFRHNKKQSTDIYLITQLISDLFFFPRIEHIILVTSDNDFYHACQTIKKLGKYVTVIGNDNSILKNVCDEYININKYLDNSINENNKELISEEESETILKNLITAFDNEKILRLSKFKKKLSGVFTKKMRKKTESYLEKYPNNFLVYQKNKGKRKHIVNITDIKKKYKSKKTFLKHSNKLKENYDYHNLLQIVTIDELSNQLYK
jgi:uncharacterized LabA/DUF88 family protein